MRKTLSEMGRSIAMEGDIAKTALSCPSHGILCSFTVFASCKSVSTTLSLVTKKFGNKHCNGWVQSSK